MVGTSNQSVPGMAIPSCLEAPMGVCKASQSASIPASASWLEKTLKEPPVKCYEAKNLVVSSNKPDLLGGLEYLFFFHILGIVIPTDQYFSLRTTHKADGFFISLIHKADGSATWFSPGTRNHENHGNHGNHCCFCIQTALVGDPQVTGFQSPEDPRSYLKS